jgi:hypothetical protein
MRKARGRSQADIELAATITATRIKATGWQIERWRQVGLIPSPTKQWLGRGRGSVSTYSPEAVAQAIEVAKLVRRRRPLEVVVLVLFARGYPISIEHLRNAYRKHLSRVELWIAKHSTGPTRFERAESLASELVRTAPQTKAGRSIARRIRRSQRSRGDPNDSLPPETPVSILQSVATNLTLVLLEGSAASEAGLEEMFSATGVDAPLVDRMGEIGPIVTEHALKEQKAVMKQMSFDTMLDLLDHVSLNELEESRDFVKLLRGFATPLAGFIRSIAGPPDAFGFGPIADMISDDLNVATGALMLLPLRSLLQSPNGRQFADLAASNQPMFADAFAGVKSLPKALQRTVRNPAKHAAQVEALPDAEKRRIRKIAAAHLVKYGAGDVVKEPTG